MEESINTVKLYYNTEREKLAMPEYGRNVFSMISQLKLIEDRDKRSEQAKAVVKVMEILNPQVRMQDDFEHKLWDHLFIISGFDLDIDSPYPAPVPSELESKPVAIPLKKRPIKANHYGRNIESIIDLISGESEGDTRTEMIRLLATYMRQQYLIWNKDSVADETIFKDIERLSDGRIKVPEGLALTKLSTDANFSRPGMSVNVGGQSSQKKNNRRQGNRRNQNKKK